MISQRLRGMSEDGEAITGLIPKIQETFDEYTQGTVSIIDKQNGGLNSTYEILEQLSKVYPTLTDEAKAYINEVVAGNRQNKVLVAILENWQNVETAVESAKNSTGSALKENEKYLNSINGKMAQFKSSTQQLWQNLISSDAIKFFVDLGTVVIKTLDTGFVRFIATIALTTTAFGLLGKAITALKTTTLAYAIQQNLLMVSTNGFIATIKSLWATLSVSPLFWVAAGTVAVLGLIKVFDLLTVSVEEQRVKVDELTQKYNDLKDEIKSLKENQNPTEGQKEYIGLLERELELQEEILKVEQKRLMDKEIFGKGVLGKGLSKEIEDNIKLIEEFNQYISNTQKELNDVMNNFSQEELLKYSDDDILIEHLANLKNQTKELELELITQKKIVQSYVDILGDDAPQALKDLIKSIDSALPNLQKMNEYQDDLNRKTQQYIPTVEELIKAYEESTDAIDDYQSSVKQLSDIYNTINKDGKVSADTLLDLIQKYPQLASQIANMNSSKEAGLTLAKTLFELEKKNAITELNNNKAILDSKLSILEADEKKYKLEREKAAQRGDGEGVIRATNALGVLDIKDLRNQSKAIDEAIKTITDLTIKDFEKSITKSTSSALSPIPYEDLTKELIRSYNAEVERSKIQEKLLNNQIKQAEKAKDYNKAIELQNKLLENQQKTVNNLQQANQKIHEEANRLRSTSKYDTISWFDENGEMTLAYKELLNSFAGKTDEFSKKEKESIEDLFNKLSLLKKGWYENADAINTYNESIDQSKDKISEFVNSRIQDEIDSLEYVYGRGVISTQQYYDALIALREKYSKDIGGIDSKILDALNDSIDEQNKVLYENELKTLKNRNEDGIISKRQYYDQLVALAEKYGSFLREYDADSFRSLIKEIQFVFDNLKKDAEDYTKSYISYINSQIEAEINAIEKAKKKFKEAQQNKIKSIQDEINKLEERNEQEKEAEERAKRLNDIHKAKVNLKEVEDNKNVRILTNDGWKYIADPKLLKSAKEQLNKLNEDYQSWELEQTRKHNKEILQDKINALKEEMEEKERLYDADIEKLRSALTENNKLVDDGTKEQIKSWDALIEKLQELGISYETELAKAIEAINNYNNAVLTMENKANIPDPKPSGIPSSSTINTSREIQIVNELLQEAYKQQKTATGAQLKDIKELIKELEEKLRKLRSTKVYDVGGIFPTNSMAINTSGKPERILPPQLTVTFDKFVNKLPNLMKVLDSLKIPNFNFPYVGNKSNNGNGQVVNYYVNIDKVETPDAMSFINDLPRLALQYK